MTSLTTGHFSHLRFEFEFPVSQPPGWADLVERWYQLDAYAFGLPQAYFSWADDLAAKPNLLILASAEGSNRTDFEFAQLWLKNGVGSPSKFVHTLPNSRSASLLQVMQWNGPLLCLQNDPATVLSGFEEAIRFLRTCNERSIRSDDRTGQIVWLMSVKQVKPDVYETHLFCFGPTGDFQWQLETNEVNSEAPNASSDTDLFAKLSDLSADGPSFTMADAEYRISRASH